MSSLSCASFYFAHPDAFLIPIEHLGPRGMSDAFWQELEARALVASGFREGFDAAFCAIWESDARLSGSKPDVFLPPRLVNVVVLSKDAPWPPYFRPFEGMSTVVYAADFEPETSSASHGAYQLLASIRLAQTRKAGRAMLETLPYLLALDDSGQEDFRRGARASRRLDADSTRALADLLPALRTSARCEGLHPIDPLPEGSARVRGTPLAIDRAMVAELQSVIARADAAALDISTKHYAAQARVASEGPTERAAAALSRERPNVLVVSASGDIVWDPSTPDATDAFREALRGAGDRPIDSLLSDLRVVSDVTAQFFEHVRGSRSFSSRSPQLEQGGGAYIHPERGLIAYAIEQPSFGPLTEEAPPYHRLLLAARAMHEWGHVAVDAGVVPVPTARRSAFASARGRLEEAFARIVDGLPSFATEAAEQELHAMRDEGTSLAELPFARLEDYRANLIAKMLLPDAAIQAYVRANVRSLAGERIGTLRKLARYAFEAQYLWLADVADPWQYMAAGTYFLEEYVGSGLVDGSSARELVAVVGDLCRCYEVDTSRVIARTV